MATQQQQGLFELRREGNYVKGENDGSKEEWRVNWENEILEHSEGFNSTEKAHSSLPMEQQEECVHSGSVIYLGSGFLQSCQQNHFLLSKMLNAIVHNFPLGGMISYCNYCLSELQKVKGRHRAGLPWAVYPQSAATEYCSNFRADDFIVLKVKASASFPVPYSGNTWQPKEASIPINVCCSQWMTHCRRAGSHRPVLGV